MVKMGMVKMGIIRSVVTGIGVSFSGQIKGHFTEYFKVSDDYFDDYFDEFGINFCFSGEYDTPREEWLMVGIETGETWQEIDNQIFEFIEKIKKSGFDIKKKDLVFISEKYEY
jgi:hypothetical protein